MKPDDGQCQAETCCFLNFYVLISDNNIYQKKTYSCVIDGITLQTLVNYTRAMANLKSVDEVLNGTGGVGVKKCGEVKKQKFKDNQRKILEEKKERK